MNNFIGSKHNSRERKRSKGWRQGIRSVGQENCRQLVVNTFAQLETGRGDSWGPDLHHEKTQEEEPRHPSGDGVGVALGPAEALWNPPADIFGKVAKQAHDLKLKVQVLVWVLEKQSLLRSPWTQAQQDTLNAQRQNKYSPLLSEELTINMTERQTETCGQMCYRAFEGTIPFKKRQNVPK